MRIVVGYDGSPGADDALADLARAGLPPDAEVRVLAVTEGRGQSVGEASSAAAFGAGTRRDREKLALDAARVVAGRGEARLRSAAPGWRLSHDAVDGEPSRALADAAALWHADLVVLGSHTAPRTPGTSPLGSVARRVVAAAPCSVRVGRIRARLAGRRPLRAVVAYDGSAGADAAVAAAAARAWPPGSAARVLVVVDAVEQAGADDGEPGIPWRRLREQAGEAAARLRAAGLDARADLVTGMARLRIAEECAVWDADVLFVGARGEHGPSKPLAGSVATSAVAAAPCSVEVVRPTRDS